MNCSSPSSPSAAQCLLHPVDGTQAQRGNGQCGIGCRGGREDSRAEDEQKLGLTVRGHPHPRGRPEQDRRQGQRDHLQDHSVARHRQRLRRRGSAPRRRSLLQDRPRAGRRAPARRRSAPSRRRIAVRWLPRTQRSPGWLTGCSGGRGLLSLAVSPSAIASSRSSSEASKPTRSSSKRSFRSQASPAPAAPRSIPPAWRAVVAIRYAASALRSGARSGSPAPRRARACAPRAAGHGQPGSRRSHRPGSDWSSNSTIDAGIWSTRPSLTCAGWLVRAQLVDRPKLDPFGERNQPSALRCVGQVRSSCATGGANLVRARRFAGRFAPWQGAEPEECCGVQAIECDG